MNFGSIAKIYLENIVMEKDKAVDKVATWLAYEIINSNKYIVSYEDSPSFDVSGKLICTYEPMNVDDYEFLSDFLEEYSGMTTASYMSGCGFFHETFKREYEELLREYACEVLDSTIKDIAAKNPVEFIAFIGEIKKDGFFEDFDVEKPNEYGSMFVQSVGFDDIDIIMDIIYDYEWIEDFNFEQMNCAFLYKKGEAGALKKRQDEIREQEIKEKSRREEQREASLLKEKIQNRISLKFGKRKIEMSDYKEFVKFVSEHLQLSPRELSLIGKYRLVLTSNKVADLLCVIDR